MKFVLILEIVLLGAAFIVLHRALRQRMDDAVRWEASVAVEMKRPARRPAPRSRDGRTDERPPERRRDRDGDYRNESAQPATL